MIQDAARLRYMIQSVRAIEYKRSTLFNIPTDVFTTQVRRHAIKILINLGLDASISQKSPRIVIQVIHLEVLPARISDGLEIVERLSSGKEKVSAPKNYILHQSSGMAEGDRNTYRAAPNHWLSIYHVVLVPAFAIRRPNCALHPHVDTLVQSLGNVLTDL